MAQIRDVKITLAVTNEDYDKLCDLHRRLHELEPDTYPSPENLLESMMNYGSKWVLERRMKLFEEMYQLMLNEAGVGCKAERVTREDGEGT